jgi:hypothetical protein
MNTTQYFAMNQQRKLHIAAFLIQANTCTVGYLCPLFGKLSHSCWHLASTNGMMLEHSRHIKWCCSEKLLYVIAFFDSFRTTKKDKAQVTCLPFIWKNMLKNTALWSLCLVIYFMSLSVTWTIRRRMVGWPMIETFERICKCAVLVQLKQHSSTCLAVLWHLWLLCICTLDPSEHNATTFCDIEGTPNFVRKVYLGESFLWFINSAYFSGEHKLFGLCTWETLWFV